MHSPLEPHDLDPRELADLSALADGTLDPARRAQVEARIAGSAELTALYERERRVVEVLHEVSSTVRAPAGLRARIEASRPSGPVRARRRVVYGGSLAGALAAAALATVLILPGGAPGAPSVSQAAGLAVLGSASTAPAVDSGTPSRLKAGVQDLYFPNWGTRLKWPATGQRTDRINGRIAVTVYYGWPPKQVAYTIVGGPALASPNASVTMLGGVELRTLTLHGRVVVTWQENGHTCVLSSAGAPAHALQMLAAFDG